LIGAEPVPEWCDWWALRDQNVAVALECFKGVTNHVEGFEIYECAGRFPDSLLYRVLVNQECPDAVGDLDLFPWGDTVKEIVLGCTAFCHSEGARNLSVCHSDELDNQYCFLQKLKSRPNFLTDSTAAELIRARVGCCLEAPTPRSFNCVSLLQRCYDIEAKRVVYDDYATPIEGEILGVLKRACKGEISGEDVPESKGGAPASGLSTTLTIGIAVGGVALVGVIAGVLVWIFIIRKRSAKKDDEDIIDDD
jgi:hypothetical protein